jgi:hypothetical protein
MKPKDGLVILVLLSMLLMIRGAEAQETDLQLAVDRPYTQFDKFNQCNNGYCIQITGYKVSGKTGRNDSEVSEKQYNCLMEQDAELKMALQRVNPWVSALKASKKGQDLNRDLTNSDLLADLKISASDNPIYLNFLDNRSGKFKDQAFRAGPLLQISKQGSKEKNRLILTVILNQNGECKIANEETLQHEFIEWAHSLSVKKPNYTSAQAGSSEKNI